MNRLWLGGIMLAGLVAWAGDAAAQQNGSISALGEQIVTEASCPQQKVTLNRKGLKPGDVIDLKDIRPSVRGRMRASDLFKDEQATSSQPRVVVRPPELKEDDSNQFQSNNDGSVVKSVRISGNDTVNESKIRFYMKTVAGRNYEANVLEQDVRSLHSTGLFSDVRTTQQMTPDGLAITIQVFERPTMRYIKFIGNEAVSDDTLLKKSDLKVGEALDVYAVDEAVRKLETHYRSRGYFRASVVVTEGNQPLHRGVAFMINEGSRYQVRNVTIVGNKAFSTEDLMKKIELRSGMFFGEDLMDKDVNKLRDHYGGMGYVFADIKCEPRFGVEPGVLDLVYDIREGDQYRVGNINVEFGRRTVALNRLRLKPGDVIDLKDIRTGGRLRASDLFNDQPANGLQPRIVVRPPELKEDDVKRY